MKSLSQRGSHYVSSLNSFSYLRMSEFVLFLAGLENSFLHTRKGYPRVSPVPTNRISPMLSHPGPDKNYVY